MKKQFTRNDIESVLQEWGHFGFIAERRKPKLQLDVVFAMESVPIPMHTSIFIHSFEAADWKQVETFRTFVIETAETFNADMAVAHILTRAELLERIEYLRTLPGARPDYIERKAAKQGVPSTLHGMTILQYTRDKILLNLPDLPWLTIFGEPYIDMFGRERIGTTPAHEISPLSNGSILVNVTRDIPDTPEGWANFKTARDRCKLHLDCNAFFDPNLPRGHVYRVPEFRFPLEMYKAKTLA